MVDVSPLVHIEIVVRSAEKAYEFLNRVFGAEKTEIEVANFLSSFGVAKVMHVKLGDVVLQFIEPLTDASPWADHLNEKGPGVHNLTFSVKNMKEAIEALEKEGAKTLFEMPFDWGELFGSKNVRPDVAPVAMIGSEDILGFRLELSEDIFRGEKLQKIVDEITRARNSTPTAFEAVKNAMQTAK